MVVSRVRSLSPRSRARGGGRCLVRFRIYVEDPKRDEENKGVKGEIGGGGTISLSIAAMVRIKRAQERWRERGGEGGRETERERERKAQKPIGRRSMVQPFPSPSPIPFIAGFRLPLFPSQLVTLPLSVSVPGRTVYLLFPLFPSLLAALLSGAAPSRVHPIPGFN